MNKIFRLAYEDMRSGEKQDMRPLIFPTKESDLQDMFKMGTEFGFLRVYCEAILIQTECTSRELGIDNILEEINSFFDKCVVGVFDTNKRSDTEAVNDVVQEEDVEFLHEKKANEGSLRIVTAKVEKDVKTMTMKEVGVSSKRKDNKPTKQSFTPNFCQLGIRKVLEELSK